MTPLVKWLLISNAAIYAISLLGEGFFLHWFGLKPVLAVHGEVWRLFTYMFLHGGLMHLLFNLLSLWVFGGEVELSLGRKKFALLYLTAGVGAGLCAIAINWRSGVPLVGASGAIFGILMAYGLLFPYRSITLLVFLIIPITLQARWLVTIFGGIEFLILLSEGSVSQVAHLGGLMFGLFFIKAPHWRESLQQSAEARRKVVQFRTKDALDEERRRAQSDVQQLLDKISRQGEGSLTKEEMKRLLSASEKLKGK